MPKIIVNGIELYYELHGQEGNPVLVLNNGILMNAATSWAFQTKNLARHYRLLQYDCRGQGQSDHPEEPYTMELHADDLAALMDGLGIDSAHIGGISYGGEVAQAFVLKYPDRVKSLILADTVSEVGPELRETVECWIDAARQADALAFFHSTVSWNFSPQFIRDHQALLDDAKKRYQLLDFPAVVRLCECFLKVNFTARLGEIKSPACIIVGELDLLKGPEYARILKRCIPQAEMHILHDAGHASCWERAEEFNTVVVGFVAKQAAVTGE
ncbi:MAG: alpha/beta fold hydrolase [Chloroflexi bacterium]|nr:MAG: alpha/beta fold hydrolase [Chloroflexota bacterium]